MLQPLASQNGSRGQSIESRLHQLLDTDLPQVIPFLNALGLSSSSSTLQPAVWNHDEIRSIWYWFGVWDPVLQLMEEMAINSWFKRWLFRKVVYKIQFLRRQFSSKYELYRYFDKSYNVVAWFARHVLITKLVLKSPATSKMSVATSLYHRFTGYASCLWFQLLFPIDINAPTVPLFLDGLQYDPRTMKEVQKCANLSHLIYGPQDTSVWLWRQLRWMILPESMSERLQQYSYSKYNDFLDAKLKENGFILKELKISDCHSRNVVEENSRGLEENSQGLEENSQGFEEQKDRDRNVLSYMIVLEETTNALFVVFRGTELITDLYHDMFFSDVQSAYSNLAVHAGYYCTLFGSGSSNLLVIEEKINKILMQNPTVSQIYFTGHSMGAALACLCGLELLARGQLIRTPWYEESKSMFNQPTNQLSTIDADSASMASAGSHMDSTSNTQRLFEEYRKLSVRNGNIFDQEELTRINVEFITFGGPNFISSLTENRKLQRLQPSHDVYSSGYFHDHCIHIVHQYDPIPILSFGHFHILKRHFLTWFTKGHLNRYFQPLMITLGSVITERTLGLEAVVSRYLGFQQHSGSNTLSPSKNTDSTNSANSSNVLFGRFLMCIAIHQVISNKILVRMTKSIWNHLHYSSFIELDSINKSLWRTKGAQFANMAFYSALFPSIFYLMQRGFLDYGVWRSLSFRVIATRCCVSMTSLLWNSFANFIRDLYDDATYFPIPKRSGKYMVLIPEDDVLYGTYYQRIQKSEGESYFKTMQSAVQPYTWFSVHQQQNYLKSVDRIINLFESPRRTRSMGSWGNTMENSPITKRRKSSVQMSQQIFAEVAMFRDDNTLSPSMD